MAYSDNNNVSFLRVGVHMVEEAERFCLLFLMFQKIVMFVECVCVFAPNRNQIEPFLNSDSFLYP